MISDKNINFLYNSAEELFDFPTYGGMNASDAAKLSLIDVDVIQYYWEDRMTQTSKQWRKLVKDKISSTNIKV